MTNGRFDDTGAPSLMVITPTYNRADYIEETIDSVLDQRYPNLRYLVIDDGSTDETQEIVAKYGSTITYMKQSNIGESRTINRSMQLVDRDYFMIVNSDDPLLPGCIDAVLGGLVGAPEALAAYPDWEMIGPNSEVIATIQMPRFDWRLLLTRGNVPIGPGACFRRSVIDLVGLRNPLLRYSADLDFWYRIALAGDIIHIPEVVATHRVHAASASVSDKGAMLAREVFYLYYTYAEHPRTPELSARRYALANGHFAALFVCTVLTDAARELANGFFAQPVALLTRLQDHSVRETIEFLQKLGGARRETTQTVFESALRAQTRMEAVRPVARAILSDPIGTLELVNEYGIPRLVENIKSRRLL